MSASLDDMAPEEYWREELDLALEGYAIVNRISPKETHLLHSWIEFSTFHEKPEAKEALRQPSNFSAFSRFFEEVNQYPISQDFQAVILKFVTFAVENPEIKF